MKKLMFAAALVACIAAGCSKEEKAKSSADDGKTIKGDYAVNVASDYEFTQGDEITVLYCGADACSNETFVMPKVGSKASGVLTTGLKEDQTYDWYVVFPANDEIESPAEVPFSVGTLTQNGPDDNSHVIPVLAGSKKKVGASATLFPKVNVQDLTTTIAVKVFNAESGAMTVSEIKVEADAALSGDFVADLTGSEIGVEAVTSSKSVTLKVENATVESSKSATFYIQAAPFKASKLSITIGDKTVEVEYDSDEEFNAGETNVVDFSTVEIPNFIPSITSSVDASGNWHAALVAPYTLSGEFNLKDLFRKLPSGTISFELGAKTKQNALAQERYDALGACLGADGQWNPNFRFGTAFNVDDPDKCGIMFVMKKNDKVLFNIYLTAIDPIASKTYTYNDISFLSVPSIFEDKYANWYGEFGAFEAEFWQTCKNWGTTMLHAGAQEVVHMAQLYNDYSPCEATDLENDPTTYIRKIYDTNTAPYSKWIQNFADLSFVGSDGQEIFYNNGTDLVLTDYGKSLCHNSQGIFWRIAWAVMYSSARWNLDEEYRDADNMNCIQENGAYYGALDGNLIPGVEQYYDHQWELLKEERGIYIEDGILKTAENYTGIGFRITPRLLFEYDYGTAQLWVGPRYISHTFFNRFFAPADVSDK